MGAKLFLVGATGYIGGDALHEIVQKHPEYEIVCLVRDSDQGALVASQYEKIRLVYGNLDSVELLELEARKADIVLNLASSDHEVGVKALIRGIISREGGPGFLIHTSGTGILCFTDMATKKFGEASPKIYDDWENVQEVTALPEYAPHRKVDQIILEAGSKDMVKIKTAIVCPPTIYGKGRGPGKQRGHQVYELSRCTLETQTGFKVGAGRAYWTNIHIHDLSKLYLKLVECAVDGGKNASWGIDGYYFAESGEHIWGEVAQAIASAAYEQGFIPSDEVVALSADEADKLSPWGSVLWGSNSRCRAIRAGKVLEWRPNAPSLKDEISDIVKGEAARLGLVKGHASQVTA
jgi:nucleoside-diphosphate-sugar epimerase